MSNDPTQNDESALKASRREIIAAIGAAGVFGAAAAGGSGGASGDLGIGGGPMSSEISHLQIDWHEGPESDLPAAGSEGRYYKVTSGEANYSAGDVLEDTGSAWQLINLGVESLNTGEQSNTDYWVHSGDTPNTRISDALTAGGGVVKFEKDTYTNVAIDVGDPSNRLIIDANNAILEGDGTNPVFRSTTSRRDVPVILKNAYIKGVGGHHGVFLDGGGGNIKNLTFENVRFIGSFGNSNDGFRWGTGGASNGLYSVDFFNCDIGPSSDFRHSVAFDSPGAAEEIGFYGTRLTNRNDVSGQPSNSCLYVGASMQNCYLGGLFIGFVPTDGNELNGVYLNHDTAIKSPKGAPDVMTDTTKTGTTNLWQIDSGLTSPSIVIPKYETRNASAIDNRVKNNGIAYELMEDGVAVANLGTNQDITSGSHTQVNLDQIPGSLEDKEIVQVDTTNNKMTVQSSGRYRISGQAEFLGSANWSQGDEIIMRLRAAGSTISEFILTATGANNQQVVNTETIDELTTGDDVTMTVLHDTGGTETVNSGRKNTRLEVEKVVSHVSDL